MLNLLSGIGCALLSEILTVYYRLTRGSESVSAAAEWFRIRDFFLCCGLNVLILAASGCSQDRGMLWFCLILCCIADVDILILKIPTELLIIAAFAVSRVVPLPVRLSSVLAGAAVGAAFGLGRRFTAEGLYDILLTVILAVQLNSFSSALKFSALILILWGLAGLLTGKYKKKGERIPLSPVIIVAWAMIIRIGLL